MLFPLRYRFAKVLSRDSGTNADFETRFSKPALRVRACTSDSSSQKVLLPLFTRYDSIRIRSVSYSLCWNIPSLTYYGVYGSALTP
jgi:hypothetical protein